MDKVGIIGAGTMGAGIAQVAARAGHDVVLFDISSSALSKAKNYFTETFSMLIEKGELNKKDADNILIRIFLSNKFSSLSDCVFIIEAADEKLEVKQKIFADLENRLGPDPVLASNTSSLSITSIASACTVPQRVIGLHFFNPAPMIPLVEIVPGIRTIPKLPGNLKTFLKGWGKISVISKDTPGFIVSRVARPFYLEALEILEEGLADPATIDWAIKEFGKFKMGPFEQMDLIGNDINYKISETIFEQFHFNPRFRPSLLQKQMVIAGLLGQKSGKGFYDYSADLLKPKPIQDIALGQKIFDRILMRLINEAADAVFMKIAAPEDVDLAIMNGVNYPKGLLMWADDLGLPTVIEKMLGLCDEYGSERFAVHPLLKKMVNENRKFYN